MDAEHGKAEEGKATESLKATKGTKPKADKATKPAGDKASTLTSTQPSKPKPAPTQPSKAVPKKKQKLVKETPDEPLPAKRSKGGLMGKIRKPKSPLKLVDEPSAGDVLGPSRPMVIREPDSGRIQLLLDVQGNGKEKRHTHMLTAASGHAESPSLDAELPLIDNETQSDNVASKIDARDQDEGQARPNPESQPQSSHMFYVGPNREHMDLEATDASTRQNRKQMDEEFTTTAYPNVQENLKLPFEDPVIPEELASSNGTMSSLGLVNGFVPHSSIHLPVMTTTTIPPPPPQPQQSIADPSLVKHIDELEQHMVNLLQYNLALEERLDKHGSWMYKLENLNIPHQMMKTPGMITYQKLIREKTGGNHYLKTYETLVENLLLAKTGDMTNFLNWYCRQVNMTMLTQANIEGQAYEVVKAFYPNVIHLYRKHPFVRTRKMIEMTLQKEQIQVFKFTQIHVLEIFFSNRVFLEISSSEDNFAQVVIPLSGIGFILTTMRIRMVDLTSF
nr:hypothetical protein [Tanacetum cinerariifolium]